MNAGRRWDFEDESEDLPHKSFTTTTTTFEERPVGVHSIRSLHRSVPGELANSF